MRLQLTRFALAIGIILSCAGTARADGSLSLRGVYYKERSTRVVQPMLDGLFEVGSRGLLDAHFLVDAITSASAGSGAVNATPFTERRYEAGAGYTHELDGPVSYIDKIRIGGDAKFSTESDYRSIYAGARVEADLAQKNATVGAGAGYSHDNVTDAGLQNPLVGAPPLRCDNDKPATVSECNLDTMVGFLSFKQILSRNTVLGLTYDVSKLDGFQANAYRQVVTAIGFVPENHPNWRTRQAFAASLRYFITATQTTVIAAYRYYTDDWNIHAHTPELRLVQEVGSTADASFGFRYYTQTASFFYMARYPDPTMNSVPFLTDDPKMSSFTGETLEAKLGVRGDTFNLPGRWAKSRFEGILSYIVQHNRFGDALEAQVALTVPFDY